MKHWKNWKNWIALGFVLTATFSNVACSKKSSDNSNNGAVYNPAPGVGGVLNGTCQNCNFTQALLFSITTNGSGVQINWQIAGDQNVMTQLSSTGGNPLALYQGPAATTATMTLNQNYYLGSCVIPTGQYQITTQQVGVATQGPNFSIPLIITAPGGAQAQAYMTGTPIGVLNGQVTNFYSEISINGCSGKIVTY